MSESAERFKEAARRLGLDPDSREFPEGTRTSADAARAIGCDIGQIAKSIVFSSGNGSVLAIASGQNRVDTGKLEREIGSKVSMMKPDAVREVTGFPIGGVPPFGHESPMTKLIDQDLLTFDVLWAAAGTPKRVFPISPDDLIRMTNGKVMDIRE